MQTTDLPVTSIENKINYWKLLIYHGSSCLTTKPAPLAQRGHSLIKFLCNLFKDYERTV